MKAIIELTKEIGLNFLNGESTLKEREDAFKHLPFDNFSIHMPQELFQKKEDVLNDLMNESGIDDVEHGMYKVLDNLADEYVSSMIRINVQDESGKISCEISNFEKDIMLFKFIIPKGFLTIPFVIQNNFSKDDLEAGFMFMNVIYNVVKTFNDPKVLNKEVSDNKALKTKSSNTQNRKRRNFNKTYVTTTKYVFEGVPLTTVSKKDIKRLTEGWYVRGHFRKYPNGNKVWIKPYSKGTLSATKSQEKTYKVLR